MSALEPLPTAAKLRGGWTGPIIDADVHAIVPSIDVLYPYMDPQWIEFIAETGFVAPPWMYANYPPGAETTEGAMWRRPDGPAPATSVELLREQVLDPLDVERAIVNCYWGVETIRHPDFAAGLCRAQNDWLIAEWLDRDSRLRGSLVVPGFVPGEAAAEIERVGAHPGIVQVLLPVRSSRLYGHRSWHPMFEAIERNGLVAGVHYGGTPEVAGPTGAESFFIEDHVAGHVGTFQAQLVSMVSEGLFQKFPTLRASFLESGFSWLFAVLWRMDREWQALRRDVPWLTEPPTTVIRERIRFSGQPIDIGPPEAFAKVVEWIGSDEMLMFATDYPHGHENDVSALLRVLPAEAHAKLMADNARVHYGI